MSAHPAASPILCHDRLPVAQIPGIEHRTVAGAEHGARELTIWQQTLQPEAATPPHRHDVEEVVLCHAGVGELHLDGRVHQFGPHASLLIPRNAPHQIVNIGAEPMRITGIFASASVHVFGPDGAEIALPW